MATREKTPPPLSKKECYSILPNYAVSAMRTQRMENQNAYQIEINYLSQTCADLLKHYKEKPQAIITRLETAMHDAYTIEIKEIDNEIQLLFDRRKHASHNTWFGEKDIIDLTTRINDLKTSKIIPIKEIIQHVVYDSLSKASNEYDAVMPANFNLERYEYSLSSSEDMPDTPNDSSPKMI